MYRVTDMICRRCSCGSGGADFGKVRSFLSIEEMVAMLKEYKDDLESEIQE